MKVHYGLLLSSAIWASSVSARAQGSFQNLGFESATLVTNAVGGLEFSAAFPGWFGYVGGVQQTLALYNIAALDTSRIGIIDRGYSNPNYVAPGSLIEGNYTAVLMGGVNGDTTLSQTSLVPVAAQSLWFKAQLFGGGLPNFLHVTLGGERLSFGIMGIGTNYTLYAADISSLSGKIAELDFTAIATGRPAGENYVFLDSIQFSNQAIPEPGVLGLLALGILLVAGRRNRARHISLES